MNEDIFNYIKSTGSEIKELNNTIIKCKDENQQLQNFICDLELKIKEQNNELKNVRELYNCVISDYDKLSEDFELLTKRYQLIATSLGEIAPKLKEDIEKDIEVDLLGRVINLGDF